MGRCADKESVEITPQMRTAGVDALSSFSSLDIAEGWVTPSEIVKAVYRRMVLARREASKNSG